MEEERPIKVDLPKNPNMVSYDSLVIDRSWSMNEVKHVTINGVNKYLQDQSKVAAETNANLKASMRLFNNLHNVVARFQPINEITLLNEANYVPDGGTSLNDALALEIEDIKTALGDQIASPDVDITITIFTDGDENTSTRYPGKGNVELANMVEELRKMGWTINFVGCGSIEKVQAVAKSMNIDISNTKNYDNSEKGFSHAFTSMSFARESKTRSLASTGVKCSINYFAPSITQMTPEEAAAARPGFGVTNVGDNIPVMDQGPLGSSSSCAVTAVQLMNAAKLLNPSTSQITWIDGPEPEGEEEP